MQRIDQVGHCAKTALCHNPNIDSFRKRVI